MLLINESHIGEKVIIIYETKFGVITKRTIHILAVKQDDVLAYCYLRNDIRSFRKNNILAVEIRKQREELLL